MFNVLRSRKFSIKKFTKNIILQTERAEVCESASQLRLSISNDDRVQSMK